MKYVKLFETWLNEDINPEELKTSVKNFLANKQLSKLTKTPANGEHMKPVKEFDLETFLKLNPKFKGKEAEISKLAVELVQSK